MLIGMIEMNWDSKMCQKPYHIVNYNNLKKCSYIPENKNQKQNSNYEILRIFQNFENL